MANIVSKYKDFDGSIYEFADSQAREGVSNNKAAIETLNGASTQEGSVAKQVSDAIAKVVANAPTDFDTLKEISDWISSHSESAAAMNTAISANTTALGGHTVKSDVPDGAKFTDTTYSAATQETDGLMTSEDKKELAQLRTDYNALKESFENLAKEVLIIES